MEQGRRIKGTVQRLIQGLSIGDEMGCIEAYKCPLKEKNGHGNDRLMQMQTHANGFQRATMGTLVHLFVIFVTSRDPKNQTMNYKMGKVIYWLTPIVSLSLSYLIYSKALGSTTNPSIFVSALLGLIFVMMGNYMPKLKVNHTVGIRLPWTLQSEDNWHKTHRLAGKLWVVGGLILLLESGLQFAVPYVMGIVILTIVFIPVMYSYQLSRKNR